MSNVNFARKIPHSRHFLYKLNFCPKNLTDHFDPQKVIHADQ
jgi:hypothetical protein